MVTRVNMQLDGPLIVIPLEKSEKTDYLFLCFGAMKFNLGGKNIIENH